jgi:hypothetical protein
MPNIEISKIKFRRGANSTRGNVSYDQGEPVYTTDTHRLYIGNGTPGSESVVGSKIHPPITNFYSLSNTIAEIGDLVNCNNKFYLLTSSNYANVDSWMDVSLKIDPSIFAYTTNNALSVIPNSVDSSYLNSATISNGIKIDSGILQLDYQTKSLEISSNKLSIKEGGIDEREINNSSLGSGLIGGSGEKITIDIDTNYFLFDGNKLSLSASPVVLNFDNLEPSWFGSGLNVDIINEVITTELADVDNTTIQRDGNGIISFKPSVFGSGLVYNSLSSSLSSVLVNVDNTTLTKTSAGIVSLSSIITPTSNEWGKLTIDAYGRATQVQSSIKGILQGDSESGSHNNTNTLSSLFNGSPAAIYYGNGDITIFSALSTDNVTVVNLSSAGFITFEGNTTTRDGDVIPSRFAIPIFKY